MPPERSPEPALPSPSFPDLTHDDVFRLETRRLWLRWPHAGDGPAILAHAGERAVAEMASSIPHPFPPDAAAAFVARARAQNAAGRGLTLALARRGAPGTLVGVVALTPSSDGGSPDRPADGAPELGYWVAPEAWGEGFATEAARALIDAFFAYTKGAAIEASARVVNPASRRVLEKCGFAYLGSGLKAFPARGGVYPVDRFRLDRRAWDSLKAWRAAGLVIGEAARAAREECGAA